MKLVQPSVRILTPVDTKWVLLHLESCGRLCYQSEGRADGTIEGASIFLRDKIKRGHESLIEHYSISVRFICGLGTAVQILRHRLASYSQESTRYCDQGRTGELTFVDSPFFKGKGKNQELLREMLLKSHEKDEAFYMSMLKMGAEFEEASAVLPKDLKTEFVMTADLREWRHFFKMRCSKRAHLPLRLLATDLLGQMHTLLPVIFEDIHKEVFGND